MRKLTLKRAQEICIDRGFEPLFDTYEGNRKRVLVKCKCGRTCKMLYGHINSGAVVSCGHCNDSKIGDRFGNLTIAKVTPSPKGGCMVYAKCDCGRSIGPRPNNTLVSGDIKTCGSCNVPNVGDTFNKLTFTKTGKISECICSCGAIYIPKHTIHVVGGYVKSCGHCDDPQIGDRFSSLTIVEVNPARIIGCNVKCLCDCGTECYHWPSNLRSGKIQSCGNCQLLRNGVATSRTALQLHELIEKILGKTCEHNKRIGNRYFDIACDELKIIVEYDGHYWHRIMRDTTNQEKKDERLLKKMGYKFLRIRSDGTDLPTEDQLHKVLTNHFEHGYKKWTITMISWRAKETKRRHTN